MAITTAKKAPAHETSTIDLAHGLWLIADPTRLRILQLIRERELNGKLNVTAIADIIGVSQATVSHHLTLLRDAQLVSSTGGYKHFYDIIDSSLLRIIDDLQARLRLER